MTRSSKLPGGAESRAIISALAQEPLAAKLASSGQKVKLECTVGVNGNTCQ